VVVAAGEHPALPLATARAVPAVVALVVEHLAPLLLLVRQEQPILAVAVVEEVLGTQEHLLAEVQAALA
jgi:hypothetical protein